MTVIDLTVAMSLLLVLLTVLFSIFFLGGKAWRKTDDRYELLRNTQAVIAQINREAERTTTFSVSIVANRAVSFLSPIDNNGNFVTDTLGDVRWERYLLFYHDPPSQEVRMVDVPLLPASFERRTPQPIDRFNSLLGVRPLTAYLSGGRVLGNHITVFEPDQPPPGKRLTVHLHTVQPSSTSGNPDLNLDITASALLRN